MMQIDDDGVPGVEAYARRQPSEAVKELYSIFAGLINELGHSSECRSAQSQAQPMVSLM